MTPTFIAEIKTQSPFGFKAKHPFVSLMEVAIQHGDWISVHTNALWGGDYDAISFVRRNTDKPILAKGLHETDDDIQRALDHGATYVLVVDRFPDRDRIHYSNLLLERHDPHLLKHQMDNAPYLSYAKFVCNSRNLRTGLPKKAWELDTFIEAGVWVCQASGIKSIEQVDKRVDAFIVGEHLVEFCKTL